MKECPAHLKHVECELWAMAKSLRKVGTPKRKPITYSNLTDKQLIDLLLSISSTPTVRNNVRKEILKRKYGR